MHATVGVDVMCCLGVLTVVVLGTQLTTRMASSYQRRAAAATTYGAMLLLWPVLFSAVIRIDFLHQMPALWLSLGWPLAMLLLNMAQADQPRDRRMHEKTNQQIDVNTVTGFCFAVGGMVSSQLGKQAMLSVATIFTTAFLLCLALVLPTPEIPTQTILFVVVETIQQSFLHWAIGLLIAGIVLNLCIGRRFAEERSRVIHGLINDPVRDLMVSE
jgi:hypothetical protein